LRGASSYNFLKDKLISKTNYLLPWPLIIEWRNNDLSEPLKDTLEYYVPRRRALYQDSEGQAGEIINENEVNTYYNQKKEEIFKNKENLLPLYKSHLKMFKQQLDPILFHCLPFPIDLINIVQDCLIPKLK